MRADRQATRLHKQLGLLGVYAIATGSTLSAGFFLLPGLAARDAGAAIVLAYMVAAIPLVPAMFSVAELATAMPRAGGVYYFVDRSLGPMLGTVAGLGTWLALVLKVAFALEGMGAYIHLLVPGLSMQFAAFGIAVALGALNLFGAKMGAGFQVVLVTGLLAVLVGFIAGGLPRLDAAHFRGFFDAGPDSILATAGFVYISYVGVTKVASLSEEVKNPGRNLPWGVFLALGTAVLVYGLGTLVMVGVVPPARLAGDLTPAATAADMLFGRIGLLVVSAAALLAFVSVANAGILSASRYPLAMSRDRLLPRLFLRMGVKRIPRAGVLATLGLILVSLAALEPACTAKLASAFQLLMFALVCLAVIVMRESRIEAYDPGFRSPLYPWMQIAGILAPIYLLSEMQGLAFPLSMLLVAGCIAFYLLYGRPRVERSGAVYHAIARVGQDRLDEGIDGELREILREKGLREDDPFDGVVTEAEVIDLREEVPWEDLVREAAERLDPRLPASAAELVEGFLAETRIGATPLARGVALPHLRLFGIRRPVMLLVRSREGLRVDVTDVHGEHAPEERIHAVFFLVSPEDRPRLHLRFLAQVAEHVDRDDFVEEWLAARNEQVLKEILLRDERMLRLRLGRDGEGVALVGRAVGEVAWPKDALVALLRRGETFLVPDRNTVLHAGDRLTIIGSPRAIALVRQRHGGGRA